VTATKQEQVRASRLQTPLLALAGVRGVLAAVAIPLAPVLYKKHFMVLVLLRPSKDVLLAAGFLGRRNEVHLSLVVLAAIPLAVCGVWLFFWLGRAFGPEIRNGKLPGWAKRILPSDRIEDMRKVLEKKGDKVVIMGRLAAFPSTLMAAAAGASGMDTKRFLKADTIGALLSIAEVVAAGYLLGSAYKAAGPWVTVVGVVVLFAGLFYVGRMLKRT
jgi:membrane protein DedA with SNARE-associated domain